MAIMRLREAAEQLSEVNLSRLVIYTVTDRGAGELLRKLSFTKHKDVAEDWTIQKSESSANPIYDVYDDDVESDVGETERMSVKSGALALNVFTSLYNINSLSGYIDQKKLDITTSASKMGRVIVDRFLHGMGLGTDTVGIGLYGLEWYLQRWTGLHNIDGVTFADPTAARFNRIKRFGTVEGTIGARLPNGTVMSGGATPKALAKADLRRILTGNKGLPYDMLLVDEDTYVEIETLLEAMPGNMAGTVMDKDFGREFISYNGTRIMLLDAVGAPKYGRDATVTTGTDVINVPNTGKAKKWVGFSDLDVGRRIKVTDGTTTFESTILKVLNTRSVQTVDTHAGATINTDTVVQVAKTVAMYGIHCDPKRGVHMTYQAGRGAPANPGPEYAGAMMGFTINDLGRVQTQGRKTVCHLDWQGNTIVRNPWSMTRFSHFDLPTAGKTVVYDLD